MSEFMKDIAKGNEAEESFLEGMFDTGYTPFITTATGDIGNKVDVILGHVKAYEEGGQIRQRVTILTVDVKGAKAIPTPEDIQAGRGYFLVEWCSGKNGDATSFTDGDITHIAFVRDTGSRRYRPFYLIDVDSLRTFYKAHNRRGDPYFKRTRSYQHCVLLSAAQFLKEYACLYFYHDGAGWHETALGDGALLDTRGIVGDGTEREAPEAWLVADRLYERWKDLKAKTADGLKPGELLRACKQTEKETIEKYFNGDIDAYHSELEVMARGANREYVPYWWS